MGRFKIGEQVCNNCINWECNGKREFQGDPPREVYTCVNCAECSRTRRNVLARETCSFFSHIGGVTVTFPHQPDPVEHNPGEAFLNTIVNFMQNAQTIDATNEVAKSRQAETSVEEDFDDLDGEAEREFANAMAELGKANDRVSELIKEGMDPECAFTDKAVEFMHLLDRAKEGSPIWQYNLSKALQTGTHGAINEYEYVRQLIDVRRKFDWLAYYWCKKSAAQGYPPAEYMMGKMNREGHNGGGCFGWGVDKKVDLDAALKWFKIAKEHGYAPAESAYEDTLQLVIDKARPRLAKSKQLLEMAVRLILGEGEKQDILEGVEYIKKASSQVVAGVTLSLADKSFCDKCFSTIETTAMDSAQLMNVLGMIYGGYPGFKNLVTKNSRQSAEFFLRAVKAGHADAMDNLGNCFKNGDGVPKNGKLAAELYSKAAITGLPWGQFHYADVLENGMGVSKDEELAVAWYLKAARQGLADAQWQLGCRIADGRGTQKDEELGDAWKARAKANGYNPPSN